MCHASLDPAIAPRAVDLLRVWHHPRLGVGSPASSSESRESIPLVFEHVLAAASGAASPWPPYLTPDTAVESLRRVESSRGSEPAPGRSRSPRHCEEDSQHDKLITSHCHLPRKVYDRSGRLWITSKSVARENSSAHLVQPLRGGRSRKWIEIARDHRYPLQLPARRRASRGPA